MDNHCTIRVIHQDIQDQLQEYNLVEFTSKLSTFFKHLNPP